MLYEIIPHLYLANHKSAADFSPADAYIVNCTKELPMVRSRGMRIAVDDNQSPTSMREMYHALPGATDAIHACICEGQDVVVHCHAGQQRSPAVVAAYLVRHHGFTLEDAVRHVRAKKPDAFFWEVNFKAALEWFAMMQEHVKDSMDSE